LNDQTLVAGFTLALFVLGAVAAVSPRSLMRYHSIPRAFGLTDGARRAMTRATGVALVVLSLWFAARLLAGAA
jgi:hypothetical protein